MRIICETCKVLLKPFKSGVKYTEFDNYTYTHLGHRWDLIE